MLLHGQAALSDGEGLVSLLPSSMYNTRRGFALGQWLLQDIGEVAALLSALLGKLLCKRQN